MACWFRFGAGRAQRTALASACGTFLTVLNACREVLGRSFELHGESLCAATALFLLQAHSRKVMRTRVCRSKFHFTCHGRKAWSREVRSVVRFFCICPFRLRPAPCRARIRLMVKAFLTRLLPSRASSLFSGDHLFRSGGSGTEKRAALMPAH